MLPTATPMILERPAEPPPPVFAVVRVCGWCSTQAQALEMELWVPMERALVLQLRLAGFSTDGMCPTCFAKDYTDRGKKPPPYPHRVPAVHAFRPLAIVSDPQAVERHSATITHIDLPFDECLPCIQQHTTKE